MVSRPENTDAAVERENDELARSVARPPVRRPNSIRRSASSECSFPSGALGGAQLICTGRDLYTGHDFDAPVVMAAEKISLHLGGGRRILSAGDCYGRRDLRPLEGVEMGRALRDAVTGGFGSEVADRSLFVRLIDEAQATTHLSHVAWHAWLNDIEAFKKMLPRDRSVEGLCFSYAPGQPAVLDDRTANHSIVNLGRARLPVVPGDRWAWHEFDCGPGPQFLRLRVIDVWEEGGAIAAVSLFHDSALLPGLDGMRRIFHEYRVTARIDPADHRLLAMSFAPGMLPFASCMNAPDNTGGLIGQPVSDFGRTVSRMLAGTAGCTHLNEALKAFQDIPGLAEQLVQR